MTIAAMPSSAPNRVGFRTFYPMDASAAVIHRAIADIRLKVSKGAPHRFELFRAAKFNDMLLEFLARPYSELIRRHPKLPAWRLSAKLISTKILIERVNNEHRNF